MNYKAQLHQNKHYKQTIVATEFLFYKITKEVARSKAPDYSSTEKCSPTLAKIFVSFAQISGQTVSHGKTKLT